MSLMLLTLATFFVATGVVLAMYYVLTAESAVEQRLKKLVPGASVADVEERRKGGPSVIERLLASLGRYGIGGQERSLAQMLSVAGLRGPNAALIFLGIRTALSFGPALVILVPQVSQGKPLGRALLLAGVMWLAGHTVMNLWLRIRARTRVRKIMEALPDSARSHGRLSRGRPRAERDHRTHRRGACASGRSARPTSSRRSRSSCAAAGLARRPCARSANATASRT